MFKFTRKQLVKTGTALTMIMILALMLVFTASAGSFGYADFSSTAGLTLVDDAAQAGSRLRLVPASTGQRGAAWTDTKQCVANGFDTTFNFQISNQLSGGADGIAFVVQNTSGSAIGGYGGGIGYHNLANSLAVEFDTWYNGGPDEPNGNHISVRSQGTGANQAIGVPSLGTIAAGLPNFAGDGAVHTVRINYAPGSMDVYLDNVLRLNVTVDLESLLSLDNGNAYVGFTSATGAAAENEDILSWAYSGNCAPPVADAGGPYLVAVDSTITLDGTGTDTDGDILAYAWGSDESGSSFDVADEEDPDYTAGSTPGIYTLTLTVDDGPTDDSDTAMIVVYDPSAGFVTGGGWINSAAGAYKDDTSLEGKANFGFVAKYRKGADVPSGNTEFQFKAGDLNFHSSSYEWLVVNQNDSNAQFKGTGTINGLPDANGNDYKFMLWAGDHDPDTFRLRIWSDDGGVETDVYDNGGQNIDGGSIKIHTGK